MAGLTEESVNVSIILGLGPGLNAPRTGSAPSSCSTPSRAAELTECDPADAILLRLDSSRTEATLPTIDLFPPALARSLPPAPLPTSTTHFFTHAIKENR